MVLGTEQCGRKLYSYFPEIEKVKLVRGINGSNQRGYGTSIHKSWTIAAGTASLPSQSDEKDGNS